MFMKQEKQRIRGEGIIWNDRKSIDILWFFYLFGVTNE